MGTLMILLSITATARAEPSESDRAQARQLAAQGFGALQRKEYARAEDLLRRADALVHAPTLVLDEARALVGLGKLVEAHECYELVLREGVQPSAPYSWKHALDSANEELAALQPRLAWLTIRVPGVSAPRVQLDDKSVTSAVLGVKRATNPGVSLLSVEADGFLARQQTVELKEGQTATVDVSLERDPNVPEATSARPATVFVVAPAAPKPPDRTLAYALLTAGGVGIVGGTVTGLLALGVHSDLAKTCPGGSCVPANDTQYADYRQKLDRYRGFGIASGVSFAVGIAAAASGAALFLFNGSSSRQGGSSGLLIGPGSVAIHGRF
jgi:hypothetical protein